MSKQIKKHELESIHNFFKGKLNKTLIKKEIIYEGITKKDLLGDEYKNAIKFLINKPNDIKLTDLNQLNGNFEYGILPFFAKLVISSYFNPDIIKLQIPKKYILTYRTDEDNVAYYYLIYDKVNNVFMIILKGTKTRDDIIKDIKVKRREISILDDDAKDDFFDWRNNFLKEKNDENYRYPRFSDKEIEAHIGFMEYISLFFRDMKNDIFDLLLKNKGNKKMPQFIFLSHSLGSTACVFSGIRLAKLFNNHLKKNIGIHIIDFASPAMGNKNFLLLFEYYQCDTYFRIYNSKDTVSKTYEKGFFSILAPIFGNLRHIDDIYNNNEKCKIEEKEKCKVLRIITFNVEDYYPDYLLNYINNKETTKVDKEYIYHSYFIFTKNKNGKLFYI
jgi:hypothetical protein